MKLFKIPFLGRGGIGISRSDEAVSVFQSALAVRIIPGPNHRQAKKTPATLLCELRNYILRGDRYNYGVVGKRCVTTAGINYIRQCLIDNIAPISRFQYHDMGTGTTAEAIGQTGLITPWGGSRVIGTKDGTTTPGTYKTVATITVNTTKSITEHGIFSASTGGTLLDRTVFAAKSLVSGDGIEFTYSLTINAGG